MKSGTADAVPLPVGSIRSCLGLALGVLRLLDDRLESGGIVDRDLAEALAVDHNAGLSEARDELRVVDALGTCGRVDTGDPELAEVTLAELAVDRGHSHRTIDGLRRYAEKFAARAPEALGELKAAAAAFA